MPTIRDVTAPTDNIQGSNLASGAYESLARTQAITASQAGASIDQGITLVGKSAQTFVDKVQATEEISKGGALTAVQFDNLNTEWNTALKGAPLSDNSVADKYREDTLEPALEKFVDGFQTERGRVWAQGQADQLRQHFFEKTAGDMASRAASSVTANLDTMTNAWASPGATSDTHSLDFALDRATGSIDDLIKNNPYLTGDAADTLRTTMIQQAREKIARSGLENMAQANPQQFLDDLAGGKLTKYIGDLPPGSESTVHDYAETQLRAQKADAAAAATAVTKQQEVEAKGVQADLVTQALSGKPVMNDIVNNLGTMPGVKADPAILTSTISAVRAIQNDAAKGIQPTTVPEVFNDFRARAVLGESDPNRLSLSELYTARADRKLSNSDFTNLKDLVTIKDPGATADQRYLTAFFTGVQPSILQSVGSKGPAFSARWSQFQVDMEQRFKDGKAAGISTHDLLDPNSKSYILGMKGRDLNRYLFAPGTDPTTIPDTVPPLYGSAFVDMNGQSSFAVQGADALAGGTPGAIPPAGATPPAATGVEPRKAGESAADYLARTGGK